jgi:enoyl-CoA hydratase
MARAGLITHLSGGVLRITLDRPDSLNSLNEDVLIGIAEELENAAGDPRVRAVRLGRSYDC